MLHHARRARCAPLLWEKPQPGEVRRMRYRRVPLLVRRLRNVILGLLSASLWLLGAVLPAEAAPGDLDLSFGSGGKVLTDFGGTFDEVRALAIQADGKIVAVGSSAPGPFYDRFHFALARYNR